MKYYLLLFCLNCRILSNSRNAIPHRGQCLFLLFLLLGAPEGYIDFGWGGNGASGWRDVCSIGNHRRIDGIWLSLLDTRVTQGFSPNAGPQNSYEGRVSGWSIWRIWIKCCKKFHKKRQWKTLRKSFREVWSQIIWRLSRTPYGRTTFATGIKSTTVKYSALYGTELQS